MISSALFWLLKYPVLYDLSSLLMRLQVLGMMDCWSQWVVSLGNRGGWCQVPQLLGGPVSGSDPPAAMQGAERGGQKGAFLTQIQIRVVADWAEVP